LPELLGFDAVRREEPERDAVREPLERDAERDPLERDDVPVPLDLPVLLLVERAEVFAGVTAARSLSNSFSAALFAFCASRRRAVSAFDMSL
jgi:hypothetical protein